jgi:ribosome maturation factor RimP
MAGRRDAVLKKNISDIAEGLGYECVLSEILPMKGNSVVRIYIDSPAGVTHADCEKVSRSISEFLDKTEEEGTAAVAGKYFIEVSSPGIERPLFTEAHYAKFAGSFAQVQTGKGGKTKGVIISCADGIVTLGTDGGEISIPFSDIKKGNLVYREIKGTKKGGG